MFVDIFLRGGGGGGGWGSQLNWTILGSFYKVNVQNGNIFEVS